MQIILIYFSYKQLITAVNFDDLPLMNTILCFEMDSPFSQIKPTNLHCHFRFDTFPALDAIFKRSRIE